MARTRVYIRPFDDAGQYADWVEVTDDVPAGSLGEVTESIEGSDFEIGVFVNSNVQLRLDNSRGRYSDIDVAESIFRHKRADSLVKITWDAADSDFVAGVSRAGERVAHEVVTFVGLLNDDSAQMSLRDHQIEFTVLGRESAFERALVPFGSLSDGMTAAAAIRACLDQPQITDILDYDADQVAPGNNVILDDVSGYENQTVREALDDLLELSNSVLFIQSDLIRVTSRAASSEVAFHFFGQASTAGPENIRWIDEIRNGASRTFNFVTWKDTPLSAEDSASTARWGYKKREIHSDAITSDATRQSILNAVRDEFGHPRQEFVLAAPLTYQTLEVKRLARVSIDYPAPTVSTYEDPYYGFAEYGSAQYPKTLASFSVGPLEHYKILSRGIDHRNQLIKFKVRRI